MSARVSVLPVFVPHLGCPHACVFCNQRRISGQLKPASPADVEEVLQKAAFPLHGEKRQLAFYGGSFTAIPEKQQNALLTPAYAAVLPSASSVKWDRSLSESLSSTVEKIAMTVPVWHLCCLPDPDAAFSCRDAVEG